MNADEFERELIDLISTAQASGVSADEIIGAMELRTMALNEEGNDDGE